MSEAVTLTPAMERFILHWGEMGTKWGVNRSVAQIHALLYLSERPLNAEELAQTLSVARSNVSTSLRELQNWGVVKVVHVLGDRRDHFESMKDVWEMFRHILRERKRREIDPTIAMLRESAGGYDDGTSAYTAGKVQDLLEFLETMLGWYERLDVLPTEQVLQVVQMGEALLQQTTEDDAV